MTSEFAAKVQIIQRMNLFWKCWRSSLLERWNFFFFNSSWKSHAKVFQGNIAILSAVLKYYIINYIIYITTILLLLLLLLYLLSSTHTPPPAWGGGGGGGVAPPVHFPYYEQPWAIWHFNFLLIDFLMILPNQINMFQCFRYHLHLRLSS